MHRSPRHATASNRVALPRHAAFGFIIRPCRQMRSGRLKEAMLTVLGCATGTSQKPASAGK